MSDSVRPHRWQPTRLPRPWDSPGKNTGVGCHFLLQFMKVKSESEVTQSCLTLATPWTAAYQAPPSMGFSRQKYWSGVPLPSLALTQLLPRAKPSLSPHAHPPLPLLRHLIVPVLDHVHHPQTGYFSIHWGGKDTFKPLDSTPPSATSPFLLPSLPMAPVPLLLLSPEPIPIWLPHWLLSSPG